MALVGEAGLLCNHREGLVDPAQQGFDALDPALDGIAPPPNHPSRFLERTAEVIRAETGDVGQHGE